MYTHSSHREGKKDGERKKRTFNNGFKTPKHNYSETSITRTSGYLNTRLSKHLLIRTLAYPNTRLSEHFASVLAYMHALISNLDCPNSRLSKRFCLAPAIATIIEVALYTPYISKKDTCTRSLTTTGNENAQKY